MTPAIERARTWLAEHELEAEALDDAALDRAAAVIRRGGDPS